MTGSTPVAGCQTTHHHCSSSGQAVYPHCLGRVRPSFTYTSFMLWKLVRFDIGFDSRKYFFSSFNLSISVTVHNQTSSNIIYRRRSAHLELWPVVLTCSRPASIVKGNLPAICRRQRVDLRYFIRMAFTLFPERRRTFSVTDVIRLNINNTHVVWFITVSLAYHIYYRS